MSLKSDHDAVRLAFVAVRGDYFRQELRFRDADGDPVKWDGYTAKSQLRRSPDSAEVIVEFDIEFPADGVLVMSAADEVMAAARSGRWDLEITNPAGEPRTVLAGPFKIVKDTTKGSA